MAFRTLHCDLPEAHVARIELARGGDQNPLDAELCAELCAALGFARDTPEVRAVVLTHRGPFFCAGGEPPSERDPDGGAEVGPLAEALRALDGLGKPSIAAIDGRVQGSGLALVLACDVALATLGSSFLLPEAKAGLWSFHVLPELVRLIGRRRATMMLLEWPAIAGGEAAGLGLVSKAVSGDVREEALAVARRAAAMSPTALRLGLAAVREVERGGDDPRAAMQAAVDALLGSDDGREALASRREQRPPRWST